MAPAGVSLRFLWSWGSTMKTSPAPSTAPPFGSLSWADVADVPSPHVVVELAQWLPLPAIVQIVAGLVGYAEAVPLSSASEPTVAAAASSGLRTGARHRATSFVGMASPLGARGSPRRTLAGVGRRRQDSPSSVPHCCQLADYAGSVGRGPGQCRFGGNPTVSPALPLSENRHGALGFSGQGQPTGVENPAGHDGFRCPACPVTEEAGPLHGRGYGIAKESIMGPSLSASWGLLRSTARMDAAASSWERSGGRASP